MPALTGTFSIFPHCHSSDCSRRSTICFSHYRSSVRSRRSSLYFSHCRSSDCSRRSATCISSLPQQCLLPQERYLYFPTAAAVPAPAGAFSVLPHCRSSVYPHHLLPLPTLPQQHTPAEAFTFTPRCRSIITSGVQHPISPKPCNFLGGLLATFWLLSHDKQFLGSFWVRAKCRARTPLPGRGEYPGLGNDYRARSLSSDSTPNTHTVYPVHYYVSVNS